MVPPAVPLPTPMAPGPAVDSCSQQLDDASGDDEERGLARGGLTAGALPHSVAVVSLGVPPLSPPPSLPPAPVPLPPAGAVAGAASEKLSAPTKPVNLEDWIRRRVFQLRVPLQMGPLELLAVLQSVDDGQLVPPYSEAKMWLGYDEKESLPPALEQLVTEYCALRANGCASAGGASLQIR